MVEVCVGVFALSTGVLARVVVVLPLGCVRLALDGEFERVDGGLAELVGLFSFRTDRGSLDADAD